MELKFAFIADYAQQSGGKLHAIGIGWDTIYAKTLPATHPMLSFVAEIEGTIAETGTKDVSLRIIDADGGDVGPPLQHQIPFDVKAPQLAGKIQVVIQIGNLQFQKFGAYALHLVMQGNEMATLPFRVIEPPTTA